MLVILPDLLTQEQTLLVRHTIQGAQWVDGKVTAGIQSAQAKRNTQLPEGAHQTRAMGEIVLGALAGNETFLSAALPLRIFPPLFNRYEVGDGFGTHVDNAIRRIPDTPIRMRTDLSMTLFLSEPDTYDGGELIIETQYGAQEVKLPAGSAVLYPATSLHQVRQITRGVRLASFLWLQSMVGDASKREMLFDLDQSVRALAGIHGHSHPEIVRLSGLYHNLVRRWAQT